MKKISKIFITIGLLLVLGSLTLLFCSHMMGGKTQKKAESIISQLNYILPDRSIGIPDTYCNMDMPTLEIEGQDIIGIVEIPDFGVELPIASEWDSSVLASYPHRLRGTVYDGSLVVGGYDVKGQFDCLDKIELESIVKVTDMTGAEFCYTVKRVDRVKSLDTYTPQDENIKLSLFVRDAYSTQYVVVNCISEDTL